MVSPRPVVDQLVIATVAGSQAGELVDRLTRGGYYVTRIDSSGGILYESTVTLIIGLDSALLPGLLEHVRECCPTHRRYIPAHAEAQLLEAHPVMIEAEVGGATVYALTVERFEQI
jgi:uncharacterized protein YaaQ